MQVPAVGAMGWGAGSHHWDRNLNGPKSTSIYHPSLPLEARLQQTAGFQNRHIRQVPPVPRLSRSGDRFPVLPTLCHLPRIPSSKLIVTISLVISGFLSPMPPLSRGYCWALFVKTHPSPGFCGIIFTAIPPTLGLSRAPPQLLTLAFETFWALYFLYTLPSPLVISPSLISQSGPQQALPCQNMHAAPYIERWV